MSRIRFPIHTRTIRKHRNTIEVTMPWGPPIWRPEPQIPRIAQPRVTQADWITFAAVAYSRKSM